MLSSRIVCSQLSEFRYGTRTYCVHPTTQTLPVGERNCQSRCGTSEKEIFLVLVHAAEDTGNRSGIVHFCTSKVPKTSSPICILAVGSKISLCPNHRQHRRSFATLKCVSQTTGAGERAPPKFQLLMRSDIKSLTTPGSANVETSPRLSKSLHAILRKIRRIILPERVFGNAGAH